MIHTQLTRGGYRHRKEVGYYRSLTREEVENLPNGGHSLFLANDGSVREVKINGKVRLWKRDKERIEVPVKYGLYEYGTFTKEDIHRLIKPCDCEVCKE